MRTSPSVRRTSGCCSTRRPSMTFGTADRRKWDVAEGVALAVGHVAARHGNRLAVATFGDADPVVQPDRYGRRGLLGLLQALRREPSGEALGTTSFGDACDRAARLVRRRSLVVVVSDFRGPLDWRRSLLRLGARHDVLAVEVRDRREQELPNVGTVWLVDPETREQLQVDTRDTRMRARFAESAAAERLELARHVPFGGRRARRRVDVGRLAEDARPVPAAGAGAAMTFATPIALVALVARPAPAPRLRARAAPASQVRTPLHEPAAARERGRPLAALAPPPPAAARPGRARGADRRDGTAADRGRGAEEGRNRHPRHRPLRLDARDGCDAVADGSGTRGGCDVHQGPVRLGSRSGSSPSPTRRMSSCRRRRTTNRRSRR